MVNRKMKPNTVIAVIFIVGIISSYLGIGSACYKIIDYY